MWFCCTVWCWLWLLVIGPDAYSREPSGGRGGSLGLGSREAVIRSPSSGLIFCHISVDFKCSFFPSNFNVFESTIDLTTELYT